MDTEVFIVAIIFGSIVSLSLGKTYLKLLMSREERKALPAAKEEQAKLEAIKQENTRLKERMESLETIVISSDNSLNRRFERLLLDTQHSQSRLNMLEQSTGASGAFRQASGLMNAIPNLGSRYQVQEEIGRGGFGTVYRAKDLKLGETVALKVLPPQVAATPQAHERFIHEATASRRITHPNVIRIHDIGDEKGQFYISMEYFPSISLKQCIRREEKLPLGRVLHFGRQILEGLIAAHAQGVIHRDLKPQNVLVGKDEVCKLIDFGLAKSQLMDGLTTTGLVLGTPEYMSPEQVRGSSVSETSDLYSFGIVVYEMLSGHTPFHADNPVTLGYKHLQEAIPPLELAVPDSMRHLLEKLLKKEAKDRPASAKDVLSVWANIRS